MARHWVEQTYAAAARDAGVRGGDALCEGISEFREALKRGEIRRVR